MKFYFYTNKNIMFDFLGRSIIAPDVIVKDIKRYRTIGTVSDNFLFVTHKKLNRKSREQGIAEPGFVYPMTIELSELQDKDGRAVLVSRNDEVINYAAASLKDYDPETHIGAYLIGEIPFSRVEKIYFDTKDDMDMFSRPSPDYWYPTNKYALLPADEFSEELSITPDEAAIESAIEMSSTDIIRELQGRERQRAGLLNFINGTKKWQHGRYIFNVDSSLLQLFGISDDMISPLLPHYLENRDKDNIEYISFYRNFADPSKEFNQTIYNHVYEVLSEQPYNTQKQPDLIKDILNQICEKITGDCEKTQEKGIVRRAITEIEKLASDAGSKSPEEIMALIPEPVDMLKALMFVAKNPNRYELFLEALGAYHADVLTRRRAMVLWGTLNGLYGMPGEDFEKDNQSLWQFIEAYVYGNITDGMPSLSVCMPDVSIKNGTLLGIVLKEERIVTAGEIREAILAMQKEKLTTAFYNKLFEAAESEAGSKKKAENKGYAHSIATIALSEIKKGDELNPATRKVLEQLLKDCKTSIPNKDKLFRDYVENEKKFAYVFDLDQAYWKRAFKILPEKKNA